MRLPCPGSSASCQLRSDHIFEAMLVSSSGLTFVNPAMRACAIFTAKITKMSAFGLYSTKLALTIWSDLWMRRPTALWTCRHRHKLPPILARSGLIWTCFGRIRKRSAWENESPRTLDIPLTFENVEDPDAMTGDGSVATQLAGLISNTSVAKALPGT